jgi:hypothetical protein
VSSVRRPWAGRNGTLVPATPTAPGRCAARDARPRGSPGRGR